jgi:hypothetical protein
MSLVAIVWQISKFSFSKEQKKYDLKNVISVPRLSGHGIMFVRNDAKQFR